MFGLLYAQRNYSYFLFLKNVQLWKDMREGEGKLGFIWGQEEVRKLHMKNQ